MHVFGFRHPIVQWLLRDLITNVSVKAQQSILSSNFSNVDGGVEPETRSPDSILYPDISPSLGMPQNMRKRTRKHTHKTSNSASGASLKRLQTQVSFDNTDISITAGGNGSSHNGRKCLSSSTLKQDYRVEKDTGDSSFSCLLVIRLTRRKRYLVLKIKYATHCSRRKITMERILICKILTLIVVLIFVFQILWNFYTVILKLLRIRMKNFTRKSLAIKKMSW